MKAKERHANMRTSKLKTGGVFALVFTLVFGLSFPSPALVSQAFAENEQEIPAYMTDVTDATVAEDFVEFDETEVLDEPQYQELDSYLDENVDDSIVPARDTSLLGQIRQFFMGKDKAEFTGTDFVLFTKYTYVDKAEVEAIEAQGREFKLPEDYEATFAQFDNTVQLFDCEGSEYYIGYTDVSNTKDMGEVIEYSFTATNVNGEIIEGPVMDEETGIVYVPKSMFDEDPSLTIQNQVIIKTDFVANATTYVDVYVDSDNEAAETKDAYSVELYRFDNTITVPIVSEDTAAAVSFDDIEIYVNGAESPCAFEEGETAEYNSDTGELSIIGSPGNIFSVNVHINAPGTVEKAHAIGSWGEMGYVHGSNGSVTTLRNVSANFAAGQTYNLSSWVTEHQWSCADSAVYVWRSGLSCDFVDMYKGLHNGDTSFHELINGSGQTFSESFIYPGGTVNGENISLTNPPTSSRFGLVCSHCSTFWNNIYGNGGSDAYSGSNKAPNQTLNVRMKTLVVNNDYAVVAFLGPQIYSQPGIGIYKFKLDRGYKLSLKKSINNPNQWDLTKAGYSSDGVKYTLYKSDKTTPAKDARGQKVVFEVKNGAASWNEKIPAGTYYLKETSCPDNLKLDPEYHMVKLDHDQTANVADDIKTVHVTVNKTSTNTASLSNKYYNFEGIKYLLHCDSGAMGDYTFTLDAKGNTNTIEVPYNNSYTLKETATNRWYKLNTQPYSTNQKIRADYTFKVSDDPVMMTIDLAKYTNNPGVTNDVATHTLDGAKYEMKNTSGNPAVVQTLVTDTNGYAKSTAVLYDNWQIKETYSSNGHAVDGTTYDMPMATLDAQFTVDNAAKYTTPYNFSLNASKASGVDFKPEPIQYGLFKLQKKDADSNTTTPEGKATFKDAVYQITYYDTEVKGDVQSGKVQPKRTWFVKTNEAGYADTSFIASGDMTVTTEQNGVQVTKTFHSDSPYMEGETIIIPCGTFTVQEVLNPVGYLFDNGTVAGPGKLNYYTVASKHTVTEQVVYDGSAEYAEPVVRGDYWFDKVKEDESVLPNVPFALISKTTNEWHSLVTDDEGQAGTEATRHSHLNNTNGNDKFVGQNDTQDWITKDDTGLNAEFGNWFAGFGPLNNTADKAASTKVSDERGALPYDDYTLVEIAAPANETLALIHRDITVIYPDYAIPGGTIVDKQIELHTTATDDGEHGTHSNEGNYDQETITIKDELRYYNLDAGRTYTVTGTLMDKATGEALVDEEGNTFVVTDTLIPEEPNGTFVMLFQVPGKVLAGKTTVVFERIDSTQRMEISHEDLNDEGQTVNFPVIGTTATDSVTNAHEGSSSADEITINDLVTYKALQPGKTYVMTGTLMDKATGKALCDADGNAITSSTEFTPEEADGDILVSFTVSRDIIEGKTVVAFEDLTRDDVLVTTHSDIDDEGQTVNYPKIRTTATDGTTKIHEGLATEVTVVNDKVDYWNLIRGEKYTMSGVLMIADENGEPVALTDEEGNEFRVTKEFVAGVNEEEADAADKITDPEELAAKYAEILDGVRGIYDEYLASHDNKEYEGSEAVINQIEAQGINEGVDYMYVPSQLLSYLPTALLADEALQPFSMDVLAEFYESDNVTPEQRAEIGDLPTVKAIQDVVRALSDAKTANQVDQDAINTETATGLEGTDIFDGYIVQVRDLDGQWVNANDVEGLTYYYDNGNIYFKAKDAADGAVESTMVNINDLRVINPETREVIAIETFLGNRCNGSVTLSFMVPDSVIAGHKTVVFETLYKDVNGDEQDENIARHEDINDEGQSVNYPKLATTAGVYDNVTGDQHNVEFTTHDTEATLTDVVEYTSLIPGKEYIVSGVLMTYEVDREGNMDPETIKAVTDTDGNEMRAQTTFTPETPDGTVEVVFPIDLTKHTETTLNHVVVFESLYTDSESGVADELVLVGQHADINDKNQAVEFHIMADEEILLQTGDMLPYVIGGGVIIAAGAIAWGIRRRKFAC